MAGNEVLDRIDRSLASIDRHVEQGNELMQLNREALEGNRAAADRNTQVFERVISTLDRHEQLFERQEQLFEQNRVFIRDMTRRNEIVLGEIANAARQDFSATQVVIEELRDLRSESRAQHQALFKVLDRLDRPQSGR